MLGAVLAVALVGSGTAEAQTRPNVVLVLTDDQRWDTLNVMPTVQRRLVARGVTFTNAFVTNALCCPSRASYLTGRYSHGTGVYVRDLSALFPERAAADRGYAAGADQSDRGEDRPVRAA